MAVMVSATERIDAEWSKDTMAWAGLHEPCLKPLWLAILKNGCVGWRTRFLDVGCGTGGALMIGRGLGAALAGIDADEERTQFAQQRVRRGDIRAGTLDKLPFVDDCCTFVMSTDLVSNPRDGVQLVKEMCRVCSPNGKLALAAWGDPARCEMAGIFEALGATTDVFRYSTEEAMQRLIEEGCGRTRDHFDCVSDFIHPSIEAAWVAQRNLGWCKKAIAEKGLTAARTAFLGAVRRYTDPSGRVCMRNHFRFAILTKV